MIDIPLDDNRASSSTSQVAEAQQTSTARAEVLVRRAPTGFLWSQLYQFWLFGSGFLLTQVVARGVSPQEYGVYAIALTAFNTASYLAAFGLEEAATIWVPRALTEHGRGQAGSVIRRLLGVRLLFLLATCVVMLALLPVLPSWLNQLSLPGAGHIAGVLNDPALQSHLAPLALYVAGNGLVNLLFVVFTALLRTRVTLVVSGLSQAANLALVWLLLRLGWGVDGALWALGAVSWLTATAYFFWLAPLLLRRPPHQVISLRPALRLSIAAWLTNLANGALLKQVAIWLLIFYLSGETQGVRDTKIGFFNLAFQLGHSAGLLLVAGLSFVGMATMAASYTDENRSWLATSWRAVLKVQTLLSLPLLVFSLLNARAIVALLFGHQYDGVGPLLQLFLAFNILTRIAGGGTHQGALYVLGKQRFVVVLQWSSLGLTALLGIVLIPNFGPMGALIATGLPPVLVELAQLAYVWPSLNRRYPLRFVARYALALSAPVAVGLAWHPQGLLGLVAAGCLFTALLVGALLLVKPLEAEDAALLGKADSWLRAALMAFIRKSTLPTTDMTPSGSRS